MGGLRGLSGYPQVKISSHLTHSLRCPAGKAQLDVVPCWHSMSFWQRRIRRVG